MRTVARLLLLSIASVLISSTASAQKPQAIELGIKPERVYEFGDVDTVNTFNGNVILNVPMGMRYPVSANLQYGLTLVYNSNVWDYMRVDDPSSAGGPYLWSRPNLRSNAGMGWRVSMGRLLGPSDPSLTYPDDGRGAWVYEDPTGAEHAFYSNVYQSTTETESDSRATVQFTTDGSHLRLVVRNETVSTGTIEVRDVEFPSGEVHRFQWEHNAWRLKQIRDGFQNDVNISYTYLTNDRVSKWTIVDEFGRTHTVTFVEDSTGQLNDSVDKGMLVSSIELQGAESSTGTRTTYAITFTYSAIVVPYTCMHTVPAGGGLVPDTPPPLPMLSSVQLPDQTSYEFDYELGTGNCAQGLLKQIVLPTKGTIGYTYQPYQFPHKNPCVQGGPQTETPGIRTRSLNGSVWTYTQTRSGYADAPYDDPSNKLRCAQYVAPNEPQRWVRTSVLSPESPLGSPEDPVGTPGDPLRPRVDPSKTRTRRDYYYNVWVAYFDRTDPRLHADDATLFKFAEPLTAGYPGSQAGTLSWTEANVPADIAAADEGSTNTSANRSLSEQVWGECGADGNCTKLLRSSYRRISDFDLEPRRLRVPTSERTTYHDDPGCGGACYTQSTRPLAGFDRVGHFRDESTSSNFAGSETSSTHTSYPVWSNTLLRSPFFIWSLNQFTDQSRTIGSSTTRSTYCFESNGLLTRKAALSGDGSNSDVVTVFTYDRGNLVGESSHGGDGKGVNADGNLCSLSGSALGTPAYKSAYQWRYGVMNREAVLDPVSGSEVLVNRNLTVSPGSGLVVGSRGPDGLLTSYSYEPWGRLTSVTPPGETSSSYSITNATASTPAYLVEERDPGAAWGRTSTTYRYDGLGRLERVRKSMPQGAVEQVIEYDGQNRRSAESTWVPEGSAVSARTRSQYDALGRIGRSIQPDGSKTTVYRVGSRLVTRESVSATGEVSGPVTEEYDAFGRLIRVDEYSGPAGSASPVRTSYRYDAGDRLVSVEMTGVEAGAPKQTRSFQYDGRGFLKRETHPETAEIRYFGYDPRGHASFRVQEGAGRHHSLRYVYDPAERLTEVWTGLPGVASYQTENPSPGDFQLSKKFEFDKGRLARATRENHPAYSEVRGTLASQRVVVTESYSYHQDTGRPVLRTTQIQREISPGVLQLVKVIKQEFEYNSLGLPQAILYPYCENCGVPPTSSMTRTLRPAYQSGVLTALPGYVSSLEYAPFGGVARIQHENGVVDSIAPDASGMPRPRSFQFEGGAGCQLPTITTQPASTSVTSGQSATLSVAAEGAASFQWHDAFTNLPIAGATQSSYVTGPLSEDGAYFVVVTNECGSVTSATARVSVAACEPIPAITAQPASITIQRYQTTTLSVTATNASSYHWYDASGNAVGANQSTYTTPSLSETRSYYVVVENSCGKVESQVATVTVEAACARPYRETDPARETIIAGGGSTTLSVLFISDLPQTIQWYRGASGDTSDRIEGATGASFTTPPANRTQTYWARATNDCGYTDSATAWVVVPLLPPTGVLATRASTTDVAISWSAVPGAAQYDVMSVSNGGLRRKVATVTGTSVTDSGRTAGRAYIYYVIARDANGKSDSPSSNRDLVTMTAFTPLIPYTQADDAPLVELMDAVNAIRSAAGLAAVTWPVAAGPPGPNVPIRRGHVEFLRTAMNEARQAAGVPNSAYTDPDLAGAPFVRAIHLTELQQRAQ